MNNSILAELEFDPERGALLYKGVRYLLIRPETLQMFHKAAEAKLGAEVDQVLLAGGFTGGTLSAKRFREVFGLNARESVEFMARMGTEIGWGKLEVQHLDLDARELVVIVRASPFAQAHGAADRGVCNLLRGVFAGLASGIFDTPVESFEQECSALGHPQCKIVIRGI